MDNIIKGLNKRIIKVNSVTLKNRKSSTPSYNNPVQENIYKRKLNKKSHNFTIPKQLFQEDSTSRYVARFIFIPETSQVEITFI